MSSTMTGARLLVKSLQVNQVDRVFCVPGESYLAVLDALTDAPEIETVVCRQEGGAAMMADADGQMTGRPGICFVTRGPGATNASAGVHIAFQDSTPMILFIGQVARDQAGREAFQEIDYRRMFGEMTKWTDQIDDAERVPEYVSRAFHVAMSGRPGPVVLALPEDMLSGPADTEMPDLKPVRRVQAAPSPRDMDHIAARLAHAERPLMVLGGTGWDKQAVEDVKAFAENWKIPVSVSFRRHELFDNDHELYAGDIGIGPNPKLIERVNRSDLLLVAGPRLGEMTTGGYGLFGIPVPKQPIIHVHGGAEEIGRVYQTERGVNAGMSVFAGALRALPRPGGAPDLSAWAEEARADYLAWNAPVRVKGALQMAEIVAYLRATLPEDTIMCNGAGNYAGWLQRFWRYRKLGSQLAPTSGSMGYGVPAAIAAKLRHPERTVACFAGDGCYLMTGQELATAVQYRANIIIMVVNNGMYGTIRMHQEREYPARVSATELKNPDFVALAKAYGAEGWLVKETAQFQPAFEAALACGKPAILELQIDPDVITPVTTLSEIRAKAQALGR